MREIDSGPVNTAGVVIHEIPSSVVMEIAAGAGRAG